jgi:hypothetical protein
MKQKLKSLNRIGLFLILILLSFTNCEREESKEFMNSNQGKYLIKKIKSDEINKNLLLVNKLSELKQKNNINNGFSARYDNIQFNLNLNEAAYIESPDGNIHSYTFSIYNEENNFNINNIILVSYNNGQDYEAYLSTYTLTQEERNQLEDGIVLDLSEKTSIESFDINQVNIYSRAGSGGGGCFDLVLTEIQSDCPAGHNAFACTTDCCGGCFSNIYGWQEVPCPGGGGGGSGGDGSGSGTGGIGSGTGGGGGSSGSGNNSGEIIPTTPMYPDGTSAAPAFLINAFGGESQLTTSQLNWILKPANDSSVNLILEYLSQSGNSQESILFALELIDLNPNDNNAIGFLLQAKQQDKMTSELDDTFLESVNQYLAIDTSTIDPIVMAQLSAYFSVKCAVLKYNHPNWSNLKIYWEASKDLVHIALDAFGMVPVVGEIADLTNGALYLIEGDGVNATLSLAATVPIAGWTATGAKYAIKIVNATQTATTIATKVKLTWKVVNGVIDFGNRSDLRKVLGLLPGNPNQAHHLIPWAKQTHPAIQKAAKSGSAFHMNEALNGIPLSTAVHNGSHTHYDNLVQGYLNAIPANATPQQAYNKVVDLINDIRTAIANNPNTPINQLNF